jgi:hypothetical protein
MGKFSDLPFIHHGLPLRELTRIETQSTAPALLEVERAMSRRGFLFTFGIDHANRRRAGGAAPTRTSASQETVGCHARRPITRHPS